MIKHDYKPQNNKQLLISTNKSKFSARLFHPLVIIAMAVCILMLGIVLSKPSQTSETLMVVQDVNNVVKTSKQEDNINEIKLERNTNSKNASQTLNKASDKDYTAPISIPLEIKISKPEADIVIPITETKWQSETVKKGDSLSKIFQRIGLTPQQLHKVVNLDDNTKILTRLRPGEILSYQIDEDNKLTALKYIINVQKTLYIERAQGELSSRFENRSIEYRTAYAQGTIDGSLYIAGKDAGLTDSQVMQLANIFDWDIDFILDIRKGDTFSLLFQEKYMEGEKIGNGEILAAEFVNQGRSFKAVRYTDLNGTSSYYTPEGLSMRKAFLRAPLKFSYISSNFKPRRFHPILKKWKAHRGIDYRASTGTPIRAAGDGKVIASSYSKYNGKYVFLQHGQGIVTKYLHMSKRAVSKNKRVKQGQVIGYVGATGLAEAPHLHYEFLVNGVHRNPRTVKLPQAKPVAKAEKARFVTETAPWLTQLDSRSSIFSNESKTIAP